MKGFYSLCKAIRFFVYTYPLISLFSPASHTREFHRWIKIRKVSFLVLLSCIILFKQGYAQTTALAFDTIPYSDPDFLAPGRGSNTWYTYTQYVQIPTSGVTTWSLDNDTRFLWGKLEPTTQGVYDWSAFDLQINYSIDKGQKFSFGIMPLCSGGCGAGEGVQSVGGSNLDYPLYLHNAMQSQS